MHLWSSQGATNTRSYAKNFSSGRKFLHRRVTKTGCEYFTPRVRWELKIKCCNMIVFKQTRCCLVIRLNNMQHRSVQGRGMIKAKDVALDQHNERCETWCSP